MCDGRVSSLPQSMSSPLSETRAPGPNIKDLLAELMERRGSDLHITAGQPPMVRINGELEPRLKWSTALDQNHTSNLVYSILTDMQKKRFEQDHQLDFSFGLRDMARFRGNVFRQRGTIAAVMRIIPHAIKPLEDLGLPPVVAGLADKLRGLVLVTGPTGSGKSTTLAALVDKINAESKGHILTVEDPIEFVHRHKKCIVNQREVGADVKSFADALRAALREDPDVIMIGEMRDLETMQAAMTVAETGHLALATLHTNSAVDAIDRIIDVFPEAQQEQVRAQLAAVLEAVVTQTLVPVKSGGRKLVCEVLIGTDAVRAMIRDEKTHQIYATMQTSKNAGMQTMNEGLMELVKSREILVKDAIKVSNKPKELQAQIEAYVASGAGAPPKR